MNKDPEFRKPTTKVFHEKRKKRKSDLATQASLHKMREYDHACELEPVSQITLDVDNLQTNVVLYDLETAGFQREHDILQVCHEYIADIYSNVGTLFVELIM